MILEKKPLFTKLGNLIEDNTELRGLMERFEGYALLQQQYYAAIREVSTKLEVLDDEFQVRYNHNPIHHMECRLKAPQSIVTKLRRKGLEVSVNSARENLTDIAGVRVICCYLQDIYEIADMLLAQSDITLLRRSDYIKEPKENGYRSLHLVVRVPIFLSDKVRDIPVEIQIRTVAMDFWASLEHQLRYKADREVPPAVAEELSACAHEIAEIDEKMQRIYRTTNEE